MIQAPDYLSDRGREVWAVIMSQMQEDDVHQPSHVTMLGMYCEQVAVYHEAMEDVTTRGHYFVTPNGTEQINPSYKIATTALQMVCRIEKQFGFSTATRAKLEPFIAAKKRPTETDPTAQFM